MAGFPSVTICCLDPHGRMPEFHRTTDTLDRIEPDALEQTADLVEGVVRRLDSVYAPPED
jgi:aminopeptidase-like protein